MIALPTNSVVVVTPVGLSNLINGPILVRENVSRSLAISVPIPTESPIETLGGINLTWMSVTIPV